MSKAAELAKMGEWLSNGQIGGRRNVLINGEFNVSQRYGETATTWTNNSYGLDRWKMYLAGSCASTFQQIRRSDSVVTNLQSVSGVNFRNAIEIDCTTAASLGSTDQMSLLQIIEGTNNVPLAGKKMTLSFWVRSSLTGTYCIAFKNSSAKTYVHEYSISSADTWEQKVVTITNDTEASFSSNSSTTTGGSLEVHFGLRLGTSSQQTTANAWNSGNFYGTSNQVTWGTSTDHFFYLAGVQLELGSQATPFEHKSYAEELTLCERYFEVIFDASKTTGDFSSYYPYAALGHGYKTDQINSMWFFKTHKRAAGGTFTCVSSSSNYAYKNHSTSKTNSVIATATQNIEIDRMLTYLSTSGVTEQSGWTLFLLNSACRATLDTEL